MSAPCGAMHADGHSHCVRTFGHIGEHVDFDKRRWAPPDDLVTMLAKLRGAIETLTRERDEARSTASTNEALAIMQAGLRERAFADLDRYRKALEEIAALGESGQPGVHADIARKALDGEDAK